MRFASNNPDRAVEFGKNMDMGLDPQKVFPFIYTFVPSRSDRWPYTLDVDGARVYDNLAGIGPAIAPGAVVTHAVLLDPDLIFFMKWVRLTVYWEEPQAGIYHWYEPDRSEMIDGQMDQNTNIGTPLLQSIRMALTVEPSGSYIVGAPDASSQVPRRVRPTTIQGFDHAIGQIEMPRMCPASGMIVFTLENTHTVKTLVVGGCIYGYKIRM